MESTRLKERILIVDDTPANIDVLGAMLTDQYDISVAVNGPAALDIADSPRPPDLILLDIMMPEMDGYEVARQLKSRPNTHQIPIIFVTAKVDEADEAFGFEIGAVDYIRKPVTAAVALARIKSQLELKRYRDRLAVDLKETEASARKNQVYFRELFMSSPYGIVLVGEAGRVLRSNKSFSDLLGYDAQEILDRDFCEFCEPGDLRHTHRRLIDSAFEGKTVSMETRCRHREGYQIPISALAYPVAVGDRVQGVFVFYENISQRKLFEEKLKHQAYHDALTNIPNRLLFGERLDLALEKQKRSGGARFAVLLIDLDRFKSVNDSMGHQAGDELLKSVVAEVTACLRTNDTLARLGGDEFAILLPGIQDRERVTAIASRIRRAVESGFVIQGQAVHISASIGIVMDTAQYKTANLLMRDADLAMYHAKASGKAQFQFFTPDMHENLVASVTIETELRKALEQEQLSLHFQPIYSLDTRTLEGFEALVRWHHPEQGLMPPDRFIPIAEETGLMIPMGQWIIRTACRALAFFQKQLERPLSMNVNISIKQFHKKGFAEHLSATAREFRVSPSHIKLEFTESLLMEPTDAVIQRLDALKQAGFVLVIDDFGTGYSSLSYLQQFPIDQLKIDRSFINAMDRREDSFEIVKSILSLARSLEMATVAEGVENQTQLDTLSGLGCGYAQGFYFARPMPGPDMLTHLKTAAFPF